MHHLKLTVIIYVHVREYNIHFEELRLGGSLIDQPTRLLLLSMPSWNRAHCDHNEAIILQYMERLGLYSGQVIIHVLFS